MRASSRIERALWGLLLVSCAILVAVVMRALSRTDDSRAAAPWASGANEAPHEERPIAARGASEADDRPERGAPDPGVPESALRRPVEGGGSVALFGSLLDDLGNPVQSRSISVELRNEECATVETAVSRRDYWEEGGAETTYRAAGLAPGRWRMAADAPGYAPARGEIVVGRGEQEVERDLLLDRRHIVLILAYRPDGRPAFEREELENSGVGRVGVVATPDPLEGDLLLDGSPLEEGHGIGSPLQDFDDFAAPSGCLGFVELEPDRAAFVHLTIQQGRFRSLYLPADADEVQFVFEREELDAWLSTIRYELVDAETGVALRPSRYGLAGGGLETVSVPEAESADAHGILHERVAPGEYRLTARVEGYVGFERTVLVRPHTVLDLGVVPLERVRRLAGIVVDVDGAPVAGAEVQALELGSDSAPDPGTATARETDGAGRYALALAPGDYRVWAVGPDGATVSRSRRIAEGDPPAAVELELLPSLLVVFRDVGGRFEGARLQVLDEDGLELAASVLTGRKPHVLHLPPGRYRAELVRGSETVRVLDVRVGDEPLAVDL